MATISGARPEAAGWRAVQGTITADQQLFYGTGTWNAGAVAFTALKFNVTNSASAAGSLLMDLQIGGVSQHRVDKSGNMVNGTAAVPASVVSSHAGNYIAATPLNLAGQDRGVVYILAFGNITAPLIGVKAAGTSNSPTAVTVASGSILTLQSDGYDGTNFVTGGSLSFGPSETWSGVARGTQFDIGICGIGSTSLVTRFSLNEVGATFAQSSGSGGNLGIGTVAIPGQAIRIVGTQTGRTDEYGMLAAPTFDGSATALGAVLYAAGATAASAFTMAKLVGLQVDDATKGAGSTITKQVGLEILAQTKGATNWAIYCASSASSGGVTFRDTALATGATVGHFFIPSSAGAPTGVPATIPTGQIAMQYDSTNNFLYVYNGGWKKSTVYA